jgi:TPR repeat protein
MKFLVAVSVVVTLFATASADAPKQDPAKALEAFLKACDAGQLMSCNQAAVAYKDGVGTKKDPKRSIEIFQKTCTATSTDGVQRGFACAELASGYNGGKGIKKDIAKANEYFELACTLDSPYGCLVIGAAYAFGEGIKKDVVKGKAYLEKACKAGKQAACKNLEELARPPKKGGDGGGTCPGNAEVRCSGVCVNIWKPDSKNCGGCGNVCPSNHYCNQGTCTMK